MLQIKNINQGWPQGGFPFKDPTTGREFDGMSADLELQCTNVISFRAANPRLFPPDSEHLTNRVAVRQEILSYMYSKNPNIFEHAEVSQQVVPRNAGAAQSPPGKTCWRCNGTSFTAHLCSSCGGSKVDAWICNNPECGAVNAV